MHNDTAAFFLLISLFEEMSNPRTCANSGLLGPIKFLVGYNRIVDFTDIANVPSYVW